MSLSLNKEDFSWSRCKKALPVFILLWAGGLLLALSYLLTIRGYLEKIDSTEAEKMLDAYLSEYHFTNVKSTFQLHFGSDLHGLYFVRITQGEEQLLVVGEEVDEAGFQALADLSSGLKGVWLPLKSRASQTKLLTVVVRSYSNGVQIQAGKSSRSGYRVYQEIRRTTLLVFFLSAMFLWPLSLLFVRLSLAPLLTTRQQIARLSEQADAGLLPETGNGPELDSLYGQVNKLVRQNRQLVVEMQQSLDNVAHDLRTPMTRLRSVAEYGLQAEDDSSRLKDALSDCLEESERVLAMLRIMMSVAEAEAGTLRLELQSCMLASSLEQIVSLYEYVAEEREISIGLQAREEVLVKVDETRISQVWANLLDNALKYTGRGGWVKISYGVAGDGYVQVVFEDNGMGISASELPRIWDRLYRGDRSRSKKGLGLGLNYVQAVVQAHGGSVRVDSVLHEGSRFVVRLPADQVRMQEKSQTSGE